MCFEFEYLYWAKLEEEAKSRKEDELRRQQRVGGGLSPITIGGIAWRTSRSPCRPNSEQSSSPHRRSPAVAGLFLAEPREDSHVECSSPAAQRSSIAGYADYWRRRPLPAPLPEAKPEDVGMSSQRLERLAATMQRAVDSGELPGVVVMIARKGKLVYQKSFGMQDKGKAVPMSADSIFRAYSMTKPVVSVAAMMLW